MDNFNTHNEAGRRKALEEIKMYQANDWEISDETSTYFLITRNKATGIGHILVALFFGWWLLFIPNVVYYYVSKETKKIMK